jgi:uncharacterized membrane protein
MTWVWMHQLFSLVCGQVNVWTVGGRTLPFCERCTGLYVGGLYALLLVIVFRPAPGVKLLAVHVLLLLQMAPFGFHLLPHGAVVRTITGELFALGLIYCLSASLLSAFPSERGHRNLLVYALAALIGMPLLLLAIRFGGGTTATALAFLGLGGLAVYIVLVIANLMMAPLMVWRLTRSNKEIW